MRINIVCVGKIKEKYLKLGIDEFKKRLSKYCKLERLAKDVRYSFWEKYDDTHTVIRFATSWATKMGDVEALIDLL